MIIKVKARKRGRFKKLLHYMFHDQKDPYVITHNMKGHTVSEWIKEFEDNESNRKRRRINSTLLTHEILSWHQDDNPSDQMIEDMTRQYINNRNPFGMYVGVIHRDKNHVHVHLCVSGVEYVSGRSMRMSKREFRDLKIAAQEYQTNKYPGLTNSVVDFRTPSFDRHKTYWIKKRGEIPKVDLIKNTINMVMQRNPKDWLKEIRKYGLVPYERSGKLIGVWEGKRKYRFKRLGIELLGRSIER